MIHINSITPPNHCKVGCFKLSSLVSALVLAATAIPSASPSHAAILDNEMLGDDLEIEFNDGTAHDFEGIDIDIKPSSAWDYYTVTATGAGTQLNEDVMNFVS